MDPQATEARGAWHHAFTGLPIAFAGVVVDALDAEFAAVVDEPRQNDPLKLCPVGVAEVKCGPEGVGRPDGAASDGSPVVDAKVGHLPSVPTVGVDLHEVGGLRDVRGGRFPHLLPRLEFGGLGH